MPRPLKFLHLEDDPYDAELIQETLREEGFGVSIIHVKNREGFLAALEQNELDIILADFALPGFDGREALTLAEEKCSNVPFIFVSGAIGEELAIETLKQGATDYVLKHRLSRLAPAIRRALREVEERQKRRLAQEQLRQSRDQLEAILSGITEGITVQLPEGKLLYANQTAALLIGYPTVEALLAAPAGEFAEKFELRDEWNRPFPLDQLPGRLALQGQKPDETLVRFISNDDGQERWSVINAAPIFDAAGRVLFAVNIFRDVTERTRLYVAEKEAREKAEAAARRITGLQDVTAALSQALTPQQVAQIVLEQGLEVLGATAGSVLLLNSSENMLDLLHAAGYAPDVLDAWRSFPLSSSAPLAEAVRTGMPVFLENLEAAKRFPRLYDQAKESGSRSWASIPLVVEGRNIGAMGLSFNQPQAFDEDDDRHFILALSRQCAQALERARLFEAERTAREEATRLNVELEDRVRERTADLEVANIQLEEEIQERLRAEAGLQLQVGRTAALVRTAAHLNAELDLAKVLMAVCEEAAKGMQVSAATVSLYDPNQDALVHAWGYGLPDHIQDKLQPLSRSAYEEFIKDRGPLVISPDMHNLNGFPNLALYRSLGARSLASVSLMEKGRLVGRLLVAATGEKRDFSENDLALLRGLADQAGSAIQNARLLQEIRTNREQLRRLTQQLVNAQEKERQRLSRELHDELGQVLSAFKINLEMLLADLPEAMPSLRKPLVEAVEIAHSMIEQIRHLAYDLRPPALDTLGIEPAIRIYCQDFSKRTKIPIEYSGANVPPLPDTISVTYYRLLQEALTNVLRHSEAGRVKVDLAYDDQMLTLTISDDGQGFDKNAVLSSNPRPGGLGLLGMQERMQLIGGSLEVNTRPGHGTRLIASVQPPVV